MPKGESYRRFSIADRVEHWVLTLSFAILAITGLVQQHIDWGPALAIIGLLGGIEGTRLIHHIAAAVLMLEAIYHLGTMGYRVFVLRTRMSLLPEVQDARNAWAGLRYNLGLSKERPQQGHFSFEEKMEYWAVVWGCAIMGITGFMLWNPITTARILPGDIIPAAKAAHGKEALLAVLAIILWHLYHVHLRHLNLSMFRGTLSEGEMLDEHPQELANIKVGQIEPRPDAGTIASRRKVFFPAYGALAAVLLAGVWFFVGGEKTAIPAVPPAETVVVYSPLTPTPVPTLPPTPTPQPTATVAPTPTPQPGVPTETPGAATATPAVAITWDSLIGDLMKTKCTACHGASTQLGGLDLSSYQAALAGGNSGPAVVPGEPNSSLLVSRQSSGNHPGQLSPEELQLVVQWIEAGALEK